MIAVIDDDDSVRLATGNLLKSLGFAVETYDSAHAYLRAQGTSDVSCLISDVQMPQMSGIELQAVLRARGDRTPVILITAFASEIGRARALEAGAAGYLAKPFDGHALIACVEAALASQGQGSPSA